MTLEEFAELLSDAVDASPRLLSSVAKQNRRGSFVIEAGEMQCEGSHEPDDCCNHEVLPRFIVTVREVKQ